MYYESFLCYVWKDSGNLYNLYRRMKYVKLYKGIENLLNILYILFIIWLNYIFVNGVLYCILRFIFMFEKEILLIFLFESEFDF